MAKNDNRYIQFYTPGSAAVKVEVQKEQDWAPLPQWHKTPKKVIPVDPVAILGFVVAVCMLVLMAVGIQQLNTARQEVAVMERYVAQLTAQNQTLTRQYEENLDLETIRQQALDLGMVSADTVTHTAIHVTPPQPETMVEETVWEQITSFLTGLFA